MNARLEVTITRTFVAEHSLPVIGGAERHRTLIRFNADTPRKQILTWGARDLCRSLQTISMQYCRGSMAST
jgi:hypothetical protein